MRPAPMASTGLTVTATPGHEIYVCERDPHDDAGRAARRLELRAATGTDTY